MWGGVGGREIAKGKEGCENGINRSIKKFLRWPEQQAATTVHGPHRETVNL